MCSPYMDQQKHTIESQELFSYWKCTLHIFSNFILNHIIDHELINKDILTLH